MKRSTCFLLPALIVMVWLVSAAPVESETVSPCPPTAVAHVARWHKVASRTDDYWPDGYHIILTPEPGMPQALGYRTLITRSHPVNNILPVSREELDAVQERLGHLEAQEKTNGEHRRQVRKALLALFRSPLFWAVIVVLALPSLLRWGWWFLNWVVSRLHR